MKFFLLALLPACAHISSHAVTGASGRQAHAATVSCVELSASDCEHIQEAVEYLNAAFGDVLLVWVPGARAEVAVGYGALGDPDGFSGKTYAITRYKVFFESGLFADRTISVFFPEEAMSPGSRQTMFRHELAHALGLPHSPWDRTSLMFPSGAPDDIEPKVLNTADLNALRAIYTRDFGF